MGNMLSSVTGGGQQQSSGVQPRAQEQISNPMSGAPQMGGSMPMQNFSNPQQQPAGFGSNPANALNNIGRRF